MNVSTASKPGPVFDGVNCAQMSVEQMQTTLNGGVSAINYTAISPFADFDAARGQLADVLATIDDMPEFARVVTTAGEIEAAHRDGVVGVVIGAQNSLMVETDLKALQYFYRLGLRILQPTYNEQNAFGFGASFTGDEDQGVTDYGREWLRSAEDLGIVVDLSHCGHRTTLEFAQAASAPVVISHANAYEVLPSPRNKTREIVKAVADTGGLIGAVMYSPTVRWDKRPTMEDYLDHLVHHIDVAGIEHVAFASDISERIVEDPEEWNNSYGPNGMYPKMVGHMGSWFNYEDRHNLDYDSLAQTPGIWDGMRRRGYGEDDIEKVMSGNWLRVMKAVCGD